MAGGGDVQQADLDSAIYEALGEPLPAGYSISNLGAGDAPSATITYTDSELTCTTTISKIAPTDGTVALTSPATCTTE